MRVNFNAETVDATSLDSTGGYPGSWVWFDKLVDQVIEHGDGLCCTNRL
jgi:predicted secreted protein